MKERQTSPGRGAADRGGKKRYRFERHSPEFRLRFEAIASEMHASCPIAWSDTYGGHWVAVGGRAVFELARCPVISNDHDVTGERNGYQGITIPTASRPSSLRGGILEMDEPEHGAYRSVLNPYLSPAAIKRWKPLIDDITRACIDEKIDSGTIDFVEDLANIVPAVVTLALMGIPLKKWRLYSEPTHASAYTPENSPEIKQVREMHRIMAADLVSIMNEIRDNPRPGLVHALLRLRINGQPAPDAEILGNLVLLIGGGFDTTTALTAHALEWLSQNPDQRERLIQERPALLDTATEEFLRYFTPAAGDGRTFAAEVDIEDVHFREGERLWLSWAMANRDPALFEQPNTLILDRKSNRHYSFGLGVHRCIGSNVARAVFKSMLTYVLDRIPDYRCDSAGAVHYDTIGTIQGMRKLTATFTPGSPKGAGLDATLEHLQRVCDEQGLARPITESQRPAVIAH